MSKITTSNIVRVFVYQGTEYPDPVPTLSPERALNILSVSDPRFTNACLEGPVTQAGKEVWTIKIQAGTKG